MGTVGPRHGSQHHRAVPLAFSLRVNKSMTTSEESVYQPIVVKLEVRFAKRKKMKATAGHHHHHHHHNHIQHDSVNNDSLNKTWSSSSGFIHLFLPLNLEAAVEPQSHTGAIKAETRRPIGASAATTFRPEVTQQASDSKKKQSLKRRKKTKKKKKKQQQSSIADAFDGGAEGLEEVAEEALIRNFREKNNH